MILLIFLKFTPYQQTYLCISGDINIHVETDEPSSIHFHELMDTFDLIKQHVVGPTHIMGHTIDIVITRNGNPATCNIEVKKYDLSHHFLIDFTFNVSPKEVLMKNITYRNLKKVDGEKFAEEIVSKLDLAQDVNDVSSKVEYYNKIMAEAVEKHAPAKSRKIKGGSQFSMV